MRVAANRPVSSAPGALLAALALLLLLVGSASLATGAMAGHVLGGKSATPAAANSVETDGLARFAVDEHNKRENALLEFVRVVEAKEQVVSGTLHHLTLEALEAGRKKVYEAKVWVKPWIHFKELQEFRHTGDATSFTVSDLGAKKGLGGSGLGSDLAQRRRVVGGSLAGAWPPAVVDAGAGFGFAVADACSSFQAPVSFDGRLLHLFEGVRHSSSQLGWWSASFFAGGSFVVRIGGDHEPGWRDVPVHDPVVKDAADHAVKTIQQRSNSLFPYELLEILHAKAEVVEDFAKFEILLKLKRGTKGEKMKAEVHKNLEGAFVLNQMQPEHAESSSQ